ncbi:hypothetical protein [Aurantiacibacter poecillastricola]|uniref:hypothetical protein n=1 Tax=Aurantiacibacter poecillastricola TaxID=3064385 RepID=UPI00273FB5F2|nr:hypothetical protein [Aurantiacibacter sp. 219JJ12-13]MDP5261068.1 hypothetical protein [Aurantiacibacter sp. 219JJ12-13]
MSRLGRIIVVIAALAAVFIGVVLLFWDDAPTPHEEACIAGGGTWTEETGCVQ